MQAAAVQDLVARRAPTVFPLQRDAETCLDRDTKFRARDSQAGGNVGDSGKPFASAVLAFRKDRGAVGERDSSQPVGVAGVVDLLRELLLAPPRCFVGGDTVAWREARVEGAQAPVGVRSGVVEGRCGRRVQGSASVRRAQDGRQVRSGRVRGRASQAQPSVPQASGSLPPLAVIGVEACAGPELSSICCLL